MIFVANFVRKKWAVPGFVWATAKNNREKIEKWPKKVGKCPVLKTKVGTKK